MAYKGRGRGGGGGGERKSEGSTADTARKRPQRPWTTARTMEVLRRCPLAIEQRLVHCAIAVSSAVLGQSHKDNFRCTAVEEQLEAKEVQLWANLRVQIHLSPLDLLISPGTLYKKHQFETANLICTGYVSLERYRVSSRGAA